MITDERLAAPGHPHLAPPGWAIGRPLSEIIREGPLTTAEATAATLAVLSALGRLHQSGKCHGAVGCATVGVGLDGWVRLSAEGARAGSRFDEDIAAAGRLLCDLLGAPVDPAGARPAEAERAAPALVAVGRHLAAGGSGWSAEEAWSAVHDAAGFCGTEPQLVRALGELADRAAGRGAVERAITRVVLGPPLGTEGAAAPPPERRRRLPKPPPLRLRRGVLPALRTVDLPSPRALRKPQVRPVWGLLVLALVLLGAVLGGIAGAVSSRPTGAHAAAAPIRSARPRAAPTAAAVAAETPTQAVSMFFDDVQRQRLEQAQLLWKPKLAAVVDLQSRFSGITSVALHRNELLAQDERLGIATVAVDWTETDPDGTSHEYAGVVYADDGPEGWRWDSWKVQPVQQPQQPPPPAPAGGGDDDG